MALWAVSAAFGLMSGYGESQQLKEAGRQAMVQARLQAAETRKQKNEIKILATQQHVDRMEQFRDLISTNNAYAAYMGRQDRSIQALIKRERAKYGRDVDRIREQEAREIGKVEREAQAITKRGEMERKQYRSAARASMFNAVVGSFNLIAPSISDDMKKTKAENAKKPKKPKETNSGSTGPSAPGSTKPGMDTQVVS